MNLMQTIEAEQVGIGWPQVRQATDGLGHNPSPSPAQRPGEGVGQKRERMQRQAITGGGEPETLQRTTTEDEALPLRWLHREQPQRRGGRRPIPAEPLESGAEIPLREERQGLGLAAQLKPSSVRRR